MRHWWSGIALLAAGVCVIVLLSLIQPARTEHPRSDAGGLFAPIRSERLVDEGVVDLIDPLPLANALSRVRWEPGILSVDLAVAPGAGGTEALLGDIYELSRASFERVNNVRQLLVRIYMPEDGRSVLLASADVRASDWAALNESVQFEGAQTSRFHLNWTAAGRAWLANLAF
ncbi:hypothetical protein [Cohnella hashimotonis]|uniref:Uncharacterized protein n=1 Tax=Cohnella hashimotonis TaxID=2826895 RepID=A0ABT6TF63_9BACL|nr:hypothetical protein [Cohnella hashimotonis]MDI4645483.1 hypothetical protein [Cohnella hashimotonis]